MASIYNNRSLSLVFVCHSTLREMKRIWSAFTA